MDAGARWPGGQGGIAQRAVGAPLPPERRIGVAESLERLLEVAQQAARAGAQVLRAGEGRQRVATKTSFADVVSEADRLSERAIRQVIAEACPGHLVLAEESDDPELRARLAQDPASVEHLWLVDPLDGTANYVHGVPLFAVSVAYLRAGRLQVGVVHDASRDLTFSAVHGRGAALNGRPIRVSERARLRESLLATGFQYDREAGVRLNLPQFAALQLQARGVRALGSAALGLAFVAAGWLEGFWELRLMPWDVAAGILLVQEAGGAVTRVDGSPYGWHAPDVLASNGRVHEELVRQLVEASRRGWGVLAAAAPGGDASGGAGKAGARAPAAAAPSRSATEPLPLEAPGGTGTKGPDRTPL